MPKASLICRTSTLGAFSSHDIAKIAGDRDQLTAERLQSLGSPLRPQLDKWSKQPESHEQVPMGQQPSRLSGAALEKQLEELERKAETRL